MTRFSVARSGTVIAVGSRPDHPERTALVEGLGALLFWDVLSPEAHPAAEIHDLALASAWLWELYGPNAAASILNGAISVDTEASSPGLDSLRALAHLHWASAWWPSSYWAGVPALPAGILRAEIAWRTAAVEHLLEDEHAVERALAQANLVALGLLTTDADLGTEARALAEVLDDLAEDHGLELRREPAVRPEGWALAAGGGETSGLTLASGTSPLDWALVPQGLVDASADAAWSVTQTGTLTLTVSVPAAPEPPPLALTARIAGADIPLRFDPPSSAFTGEIEAPQGFMMLPAAERTLVVFAPDFAVPAAPDPDAAERQAAVVTFALERLTAPDASLTERAARA
ncbi:hypothetical protein AB0B28_22010 [Glycomyces sp. NPDC046736]|uniref:hypothetical protein n=1 Tax=Glycomyces sp. NPDC046736 TaxID=3155615 RepID=UPI0033C95C8C